MESERGGGGGKPKDERPCQKGPQKNTQKGQFSDRNIPTRPHSLTPHTSKVRPTRVWFFPPRVQVIESVVVVVVGGM